MALALYIAGRIRVIRFISDCVVHLQVVALTILVIASANMIGGALAAAILGWLTPGKTKVGVSLAPGLSPPRGVFIEAFATQTLILAILSLEKGQQSRPDS